VKLDELIKKARERDLSDTSALQDLFDVCRLYESENFEEAHSVNKEVRRLSAKYSKERTDVKMFELNKRALLFDAPYELDAYLQYLEWNRKPQERFYLPRRRIMKRVADAMQRLVDGDLDELFLSMPPRVGKTTMLMLFMTWLVGRDPERSNLYSAYSDVITSAAAWKSSMTR